MLGDEAMTDVGSCICNRLNLPRKITNKTLVDRAFEIAGQNPWNSTPANIDSQQGFKRHLKAHLFLQAFCS